MREMRVPRLCAQRLCPQAASPAAVLGEQPLYPSPPSSPQIAGTQRASPHSPLRPRMRGNAWRPRGPSGSAVNGGSGSAALATCRPPCSREMPGHQGGGRSTCADRRQGQPSRTPEASYRPSLSRMYVSTPTAPTPASASVGSGIMALGSSFTGSPYPAHLVLRHARTRELAPGESHRWIIGGNSDASAVPGRFAQSVRRRAALLCSRGISGPLNRCTGSRACLPALALPEISVPGDGLFPLTRPFQPFLPSQVITPPNRAVQGWLLDQRGDVLAGQPVRSGR